jgi:predicted TIM-barrel fold metal-dependent hydrolase
MDFTPFANLPILDGHIHFPHPALVDDLLDLSQSMGVRRMNLVSTPDLDGANHNPALIRFKLHAPEKAYCCGALDYFSVLAAPERARQAMAEQVLTLKAAGFDGLKILESKPMVRKIIGLPFDGPAYAEMWSLVEDLGLPIVWHVADPESFWDGALCPDWARQAGWFYGDGTHPSKEQLYAEVDHVLERHPNLKIIFAHFYFLSADLERAAAFLEGHPHVYFDLTPGSEMYFNFSLQPEMARSFFIQFQDRLIYGTDIGASAIGQVDLKAFDRPESLGRAWFVRRFLEHEGAFSLPPGVSHWASTGMHLEGLALPLAVLEKIYFRNFEALFGTTPAALSRPEALALLERLAAVIDARVGEPAESPARQVARELSAIH